jgi:hypothetical protein
MALTPHELTRLRKKCDQLDDGPDYRCKDYVENLLNSALDFRMRAKTFDAAMNYFKKTHGAKNHQDLKDLLMSYSDTQRGNHSLAKSLWNNNHGSRAKFLRKIIQFLEDRGVKDQESLDHWVNAAIFETHVKGQLKTKEHSIGYTLFQWLRVRCGANTVKPDVRVLKFVSNVIGRKVNPVEAVTALETVAKDSNRRANRLDAAIWHFMDNRPTPPCED